MLVGFNVAGHRPVPENRPSSVQAVLRFMGHPDDLGSGDLGTFSVTPTFTERQR